MLRTILLALCIAMPISASAQGEYLTRREGYLRIWESIRRPSALTQHASFVDVREGDEGHEVLTWGKRRKLIDDIDSFRPNDPLTLEDALIWTYRTRNVAEVPDMERQDLPRLHQKFPIIEDLSDLNRTVNASELMNMMVTLDTLLADREHEVSFYSDDFHGQNTAFGEVFDMHALTAAHRTLPHDTLVKVTNTENGKSVTVRVNDRGPYAEGRGMDLSRAAFEAIAPLSRGVLTAKFLRLGDKDMVDACADKPSVFQRRITRDVRFHRGVPHVWELGKPLTLGSTSYFAVRNVTFPDGNTQSIQSWISPDEKFTFTPSKEGEYLFHISTPDGYGREFFMTVRDCMRN